MGLGTFVEIITKYTGIKWIVKKLSIIFEFDCGCDQRKEDWDNFRIKRKH